MEDGVDFKQSWRLAFLSYVYSPTLYLSPSERKSGLHVSQSLAFPKVSV